MVDDVSDIRYLYRRALEEHGRFRVDGEAANGEEAVAVAEEQQPDVMLLDLAMPGMGGAEVLAHLRGRCPATRVVLVSGMDLQQRAPLFDTRAVGYLEKALSPRELVAELLVVIHALDQADAAIAALGLRGEDERSGRPSAIGPVPEEWSNPERLADVRAAATTLADHAVRRVGPRFEIHIELGPESIRLTMAEAAADDSGPAALGPWALRAGVDTEPWGSAVWVEVIRPD